MAIDFTTACRWRRRLGLAASVMLVAAGLLLPAGGSAVAQGCPKTDGGRAPSQVSAADRGVILQLHNQYRNEVGVSPLAWDGSLADAAQRWADVTAPLGQDCHDEMRNGQGENIANWPSVARGVRFWYDEKSDYDRNPEPVKRDAEDKTNWKLWGHYSQMVWSSTQRVGCGQAAAKNFPGNVLLVCRYSPGGNIWGQYPYPPRTGGPSPGTPGGQSPGTPGGQPPGTPTDTTSAASQALTLVNQERAKVGCGSLQVVSKLQALAEQQSRDQAARDRSGSDGADGSTLNSRLSGLGYSQWGENIAWFSGDPAPSAQKAVNTWAGKPNMRNCAFKETGLAVARSSSGKFYWTQTLGG